MEKIVGACRGFAWVVLVGAAGCIAQPDPEATSTVRGALTSIPSVVTQHNDLGRTGANLSEVILTPSNVTQGKFGKLGKLLVDGQIYGQPLYVPGLSGLPNVTGSRNVVFVATEKNKVYAFDADNVSLTSPPPALWERDLEAAWMPATFCGNSTAPYGINSTPVIDPATSTIYVAVRTVNASGTVRHLLHALSLTDGTEKQNGPLDMGATASGAVTAPTPTGGTVTFDPNKHQNRVALTLSSTHVLSVGFGSYCDQDSFHGWLMRFDVSTPTITRLVSFVTTPNTSRGALWQGGNGFADDGTGAIYMMTGNGPLKPATRDSSGTSLGDAFVKLTGTVSTTVAPVVSSWFMPSNFGTLDDGDLDIGSSGPLLIPGTSLLAGASKNGVLYLINKDTMGGFNAAGDSKAVQELQIAPGGTSGHIVGSPIFWNRGTAGTSMMYIWPGNVPLKQFSFNATTGFTQVDQSAVNPQGDQQGGNLSLSANGTTAGTGIIWATHSQSGGGGGGAAVAGLLYAFNADNVTTEIWDSNTAGEPLQSYAKYTMPTVVNGRVYVPTFSGEVDVYGLFATSADGGVRDAGAPVDAGGPVVLTCATVDGGAPQPTSWSYVYSTYFAGGTPDGGAFTLGHCAECHTSTGRGAGFFVSGTNKDDFYSGLVHINQISPDAGASSAFGNPATSPLYWFGQRSNGLALMPQDVQPQDIPNPRAVAAVCGWIKAGAINDVVCPTGQTACNNVCFDLTNSSAHCGSCTNACATGSTCLSGLCCATGFVNCGGTCVNLTANPNCGACGTTCGATQTCTNKTCLLSNGQTCSTGMQCATGSCVDNVCCGSASCGTCMACSNARTGQASGACAPIVTGGADTRCVKGTTCGLDGTCNGAGACRNAVSGTNCGAASCTAGTAQPASTCNGSGTCVTPATKPCTPFICGSTACATTCTTNASCATGNQCSGGACVACPGGVCCASGQVNCTGVCVTTTNDVSNCGGCGIKCTAPTNGTVTCSASACVPACGTAGTTLCGSACVTTASDVSNCGGCGIKCTAPTNGTVTCSASACVPACGTAGTTLCGSACVTTASDVNNCGACGTKCTAPTNGSTSCSASVCKPTCGTAGTTLCGSACVTTASDINNCGACGTKCTAPTNGSTSCSASVCKAACTTGTLCGSACIGTTSDVNNCGGCGITCTAPTGGSTSCVASVCKPTCTTGTLCGSACIGTTSDVNNCGGCGVKCTAPTGGSTSCVASVCKPTCTTGTLCGSACIGTTSDVNNCGGCGITCTAPTGGSTSCVASVCKPTCTTGTLCGSACIGTTSDVNNCGGCGITCTAPTGGSTSCVASVCKPTCTTGTLCGSACIGTTSDVNNCGGCGVKCTAPTGGATSCVASVCKPTCTTGTLCGSACIGTTSDVNNCGGCGIKCATGSTCTNGACTAATCTTTNALIDNFEDANNQISLLEGRNGPDYTYADTAGSTITPASGSTFVPATPGNASSTHAAHFNGKLASAATDWAGFGMDFLAPKGLYNASKYAGISFFAKLGSSTASSAVRVKVPDRNTDPTGGVCTSCSNDFGVDLTLTTTWTKYTILFSSMAQQAGWGAPRPAKIDPTGVVAVQFQVTAPGATYDIWVDDVTFTCN